ncbi:MAG: diguanylate cyclase [Roseiarcus sp.]|jgi:diguanylate cyclase (GGDEF)-like protein|uniref:sensor domain-containing diguanylate cyclase n=1 Tax=Roseiarcus sp. TaxID=1969460 RepID=UPI003C1D18C8
MQTFHSRLGRRVGAPPARQSDHGFAVSVMEHLGVPAFVLGADRRVLMWNKACERLTGAPAENMLGTRDHWRAFYDKRRPCLADLVLRQKFEDIALRYARGGRAVHGRAGAATENWCEMPRLGRPLYLAADASPIYDEAGAMIAAVETLRDLTVEKQRQTELESLAALDGLTGLLNRRSFDERLTLEARRALRAELPLALLMVDVDDFKPYNDAHGHQVGDACLRTVAQAIRGALWRAGDVAARYGGDEFSIILPDTDRIGALRVAEHIRGRIDALRIANPFSAASRSLTLSIGGCVAARGFDGSAERLVALSDAELYRAKRGGRNRTSIATCESDPAAFGEQPQSSDLASACGLPLLTGGPTFQRDHS